MGLTRPSAPTVHERSIRMRAVTPGDQNTDGEAAPLPFNQCTDSVPKHVQDLARSEPTQREMHHWAAHEPVPPRCAPFAPGPLSEPARTAAG